jgi:hypothetical protein
MDALNKNQEEPHPIIKNEWLKLQRNTYTIKIFSNLAGYVAVTLWLNSIRATASLWLVWILIVAQLILYVLIFSISYLRLQECGLKRLGLIVFVLFILGRVENWEILAIPITIAFTLIISFRNKTLVTQ